MTYVKQVLLCTGFGSVQKQYDQLKPVNTASSMPLGRASDFNTLIVYNPAYHSSYTPREHRKVTGFNLCIPPHSILTCAVSTLSKSGVHNEGNCLKSGDFRSDHHTCTVFKEVSSPASSLSIQYSILPRIQCL